VPADATDRGTSCTRGGLETPVVTGILSVSATLHLAVRERFRLRATVGLCSGCTRVATEETAHRIRRSCAGICELDHPRGRVELSDAILVARWGWVGAVRPRAPAPRKVLRSSRVGFSGCSGSRRIHRALAASGVGGEGPQLRAVLAPEQAPRSHHQSTRQHREHQHHHADQRRSSRPAAQATAAVAHIHAPPPIQDRYRPGPCGPRHTRTH